MRFLAAFVFSVVVIALLYATVAYAVNPRGEFATNKFPNLLSDALTEKQHLFAVEKAHGVTIDGVILGSSRSMKLRPTQFEEGLGGHYFNFAVNNARTEDLLLIYRWVRRQGVHPKVVVIGLDVEGLHNLARTDLKPAQLVDIKSVMPDRSTQPDSLLHRAQMSATLVNGTLQTEYCRDIARSVELKVRPSLAAKLQSFDEDGYQHYRRFEEQRRAGTFNLDGEITAMKDYYVTRFFDMKGLSSTRKAYLEQIIKAVEQDGGRVAIWITPLHPVTLDRLYRATRYADRLDDVRVYTEELHSRYGVIKCDCSDIELFGGTKTGWYDGAHMDESNASLVAKRIIGLVKDPQPVNVR